MIDTIFLQHGANLLNLNDGFFFKLEGVGGLGLYPVTRYFNKAVQQRGESDEGFTEEARIVDLVLRVGGRASNHEDARRIIANAFRPRNEPLTLQMTTDGGRERWLNVHYLAGLEFDHSGREVDLNKVVIQVKTADDPTLYDPNETVLNVTAPSLGSGFAVPMPVPFAVGTSYIDETVVVNYAGSEPTFPKITINGEMTNPFIINETLGVKIELNGSIGAGEQIIIDTAFDAKTVVNQDGDPIDELLTNDSDLTSFRIADDREASGGVNVIRFGGSNVTGNSSFVVTWNERFSGI